MSRVVSLPDGTSTTLSDIDYIASNPVLTRAQVWAAQKVRLHNEWQRRLIMPLTYGEMVIPGGIAGALELSFDGEWAFKQQIGWVPTYRDAGEDYEAGTWQDGDLVAKWFEKTDGSPIQVNANNLESIVSIENGYEPGMREFIANYRFECRYSWRTLYVDLKADYDAAVSDATSITNMKVTGEDFEADVAWPSAILL